MERKGLVIVNTGNGKGKTTAALGLALRAVGQGMKVSMVQFIKGGWKYGELKGIKMLAPNVELHTVGEGFVGILDDNKEFEEHQKSAREGIIFAREKINSGEYDLVILDELNVALDLNLVSHDDVETLLSEKNEDQHLVITGRGAPEWLVERADLVTEMKEIKHPFQKGVLAQKGIDW